MITTKVPRQVGDLGGAENSVAGSGPISSRSLSDPTDKRAALRRLLHQIDLGEPLRRRAVQEAISQAEASWWIMRAEHFDRARPRPGDYPGGPVDWEGGAVLDPPKPDREADERFRGIVQACLAKASLIAYESGGDLNV